jgi:hypothetical protein
MIAGEGFDDFVFYGLDRLPVDGEELKTPHFTRGPGEKPRMPWPL